MHSIKKSEHLDQENQDQVKHKLSKIGKLPVAVHPGIKVEINGLNIKVHGPKGKLEETFKGNIVISMTENEIRVSLKEDAEITKFDKAMLGTARSIINNMVEGVQNGFKTQLNVVGVGYRVTQITNGINLNYGYSHPIKFFINPEHRDLVKINAPKQDSIIVEGCSKALIGLYVSKILKLRAFNPYKSKGISIAGVKMYTKKRKTKK